jgi:hypothetical protein
MAPSLHPPPPIQERARELLGESKSGRITADEQWELDQFEHVVRLFHPRRDRWGRHFRLQGHSSLRERHVSEGRKKKLGIV